MEIKTFNGLDVKVYEDNVCGLDVYIVPLERNGISVSYVTKFGGKDIFFAPLGENDIKDFPPGVAHFLEHKLFEREDGKNAFDFFNETGTYNNAFTSKEKTEFIFQGPKNYEENLKFLIEFALTPNFSKDGVEKEKPIILEEARATKDSPINMVYDVAMKNLFWENSYMFPIIGTNESIVSITKEDLIKCHKTFYRPSNMFLVATGNVDPDKTVKAIESVLKKFDFSDEKIKRLKFSEKDEVYLKYEEVYMPITDEIFYIAYKINLNKYEMDFYRIYQYLKALFVLKFGTLSSFSDEEFRCGNLLENLGVDIIKVDDYLIFGIYGVCKDSALLIDKINNILGDLSISESDLNLLKKTTLSNLVLMNEQVDSVNKKIVNDIITYGRVRYDIYDLINTIDLKGYNDFTKCLDLSNYTTVVAKKGKKD